MCPLTVFVSWFDGESLSHFRGMKYVLAMSKSLVASLSRAFFIRIIWLLIDFGKARITLGGCVVVFDAVSEYRDSNRPLYAAWSVYSELDTE